MNIEQARLKAKELYDDLYPATVAYFNIYRETDAQNPETQFEARFLLSMIATRLYQEAFAHEGPPHLRTKVSRDLMKLIVETEDQETTTFFWLMLCLAEVPNFEQAFQNQVSQAITIQGNLNLEDEAVSMPQ
jgi:hypothetical protein